ncbi:MAG: hypothetical protein AB1489_31220, partial [Acidobacteriota bacterium]
HLLRLHDGEDGLMLGEFVGRFVWLRIHQNYGEVAAGEVVKLLAIEWLLLQNPHAHFDAQRPRLPGQQYPGLGMAREVLILLKIMAEQLEREGLLVFPEYYHNAFLYDLAFRFLSPTREGELHALERDLNPLTLAEASWAVENNLVIDEHSGEPYYWHAEEMILPLSKRLESYLNSPEYQTEMARVTAECRFCYDPQQVQSLISKVHAEENN